MIQDAAEIYSGIYAGRKRTMTLLSINWNPSVPRDMYGFLLEGRNTQVYSDYAEKHLAHAQEQQDKLLTFKREGGLNMFDNNLLHPYDEYIAKHSNNGTLTEEEKKNLVHFGGLVRGGIPANLRAEVWLYLSGVHKKLPLYKGVYHTLLEKANATRKATLTQDQIEKDLARTFPGFSFTPMGYEFQPSLRRLLRAYSIRNPCLGYCQSMNFIAGGLLVFLDEEEAFWVFCWLVEQVLHGYFSKTMIGLQVDSKIFENLLKMNFPQVSKHLRKIGMSFILCTAQWFLCLFLNTFHSEAAFGIWDALFFFGTKILQEVSVNIFGLYQNEILELKEPTEVVSFLNRKVSDLLDISVLLKNPIEFFEPKKLDKRKATYHRKIEKDVLARHATLQIIELMRLSHFGKAELERMMDQFKQLEGVHAFLGLNIEVFAKVISRIFSWQQDEYFMSRLFYAFDVDQDSVVDFKELICGISVLCRGTIYQKLKMVFKMFDENDDMLIDKQELAKLLSSTYKVCRFDNNNNYNDHNKIQSPTFDSINRRKSLGFGLLSSNNNSNNNNGNNINNTLSIPTKLKSSRSQIIGPNYINNHHSNHITNLFSLKSSKSQTFDNNYSLIINNGAEKQVDDTKEVSFFVDMLFKAANNTTSTSATSTVSPEATQSKVDCCGITFDQFREVILLQPIIVQCFHLGISAPLYDAEIDIVLL